MDMMVRPPTNNSMLNDKSVNVNFLKKMEQKYNKKNRGI